MSNLHKCLTGQETVKQFFDAYIQEKEQGILVPAYDETCKNVNARIERNRKTHATTIFKLRYAPIALIIFFGLIFGFNINARSLFTQFIKEITQSGTGDSKNTIYRITLEGFNMGEILHNGDFTSYEGIYDGHTVEVHTRPYEMPGGAMSNMTGEQHRIEVDISTGGEAIVYVDKDGCAAFIPIGSQELIVIMDGGSINDITAIIQSIKKAKE